ncbi:MAG: glycosyltransferase family 4 protein [Thermoplasmata archaeon]
MSLRVLHSGNLASVGRNLCLGLRRKGIEADLVYSAYSDRSGLLERGDKEWTSLVDARRGRAMGYVDRLELVYGWRLTKDIDVTEYDMLHFHSVLNPINMGLAVRNILREFSPVILHYHGSVSSRVRGLRHTLRSYFLRRNCPTVLCSTPNILDNIRNLPQRKRYLPNPVDTSVFKPGICPEENSNTVLCWVKLERVKGIDVFFETARLLPQFEFHIPNVSLTGEQRHYIDRKVPNVSLIPAVPHTEVAELIRGYPIVLGQLGLGVLGVSELEAMSCGKPLIGFWNREYDVHYDDPCPIPSSIDPREISLMIQDHIGDSSLGMRCRKWVEKYHSIDVVAKQLADVYREVTEN